MRENGFTLVEVLVALVVGAMLMVTLSWSLSMLTRQLGEGRAEDRAQEAAAVAETLASLLERAQPPGRDGAGFQGDEKRLAAVVPPPLAAGSAGPLRLTLEVRPSGDREDLVASFKPLLEEAQPLPAAAQDEMILLQGYRDIHFSYVAATDPQIPRLPRMIDLALTDTDGRERRIAIAPRIDSDGACHFDPISMSCRF